MAKDAVDTLAATLTGTDALIIATGFVPGNPFAMNAEAHAVDNLGTLAILVGEMRVETGGKNPDLLEEVGWKCGWNIVRWWEAGGQFIIGKWWKLNGTIVENHGKMVEHQCKSVHPTAWGDQKPNQTFIFWMDRLMRFLGKET